MCEKDYFNDSDEIFNLYSFKNVTQTYKDQLKKLMGNNLCSPEKTLKDKNDIGDGEKNYLGTLDFSLLDNDTSPINSSSIEIDEGNKSDSVEVIFTSKEGLRRSSRLQQKKSSNINDLGNGVVSSDIIIPQFKKKRKQGVGKSTYKKVKGVPEPEEIIIDDSLESSITLEEEVNPEISIKVIWKSISIKKFLIRKFQKMSKIYKELSREENIPESKIILTFKNVKINQNDTPSSLNLQVFDFLEGGILSESTSQTNTFVPGSIQLQEDFIVLQFQNSNKKIIKLSINKSEKMKIVMIKYSEQVEEELKNIKFFFDGELLNSSSTPTSLGLENNDIIDIVICNNLQ